MQKVLEKMNKLWQYILHRYRGSLINVGGALDTYGVYTLADVVPDDAVVLSFGIGTDSLFEEDILKRYHNAHVYAFDPTPMTIEYVRKLDDEPRFHFYPYGLSKENGMQTFYLPKNKKNVSCSMIKNQATSNETIQVEMKTFSSILTMCNFAKEINILKMDIEGVEFSVIDDILNLDIDIQQICLEIHPYIFKDRFNKSKGFINKLLAHQYVISHISRYGLGDELSFVKI